MPSLSSIPEINASLNAASAVLLTVGRALIRRGQFAAHRACMIAAVVTSSAFLTGYLYYHAHVGNVRFRGHGWSRPVYFSILISHTLLAACVLPLVIITLWRALFPPMPKPGVSRAVQYARHRAVARWTFPVWMYVSVTGVVIYFMLYRIFV